MATGVPKWTACYVFFAFGIIVILAVLFLPITVFLIYVGFACSITISVLILMVTLYIQWTLNFSFCPMVPLNGTILHLTLNIAITRIIRRTVTMGH